MADTQDDLMERAKQEFPILKQYDIPFKNSPGGGDGYLESWKPGEPGSTYSRRPAELPLNRFSIENYRSDTKPIDVLADVASHHLVDVDPKMKGIYSDFKSSMQPWQEDILKNQYKYAQQNESERRDYGAWKDESGLPGYFRGYTFKQWPDEFNKKAYTPEQMKLLDSAMHYLRGEK